MIMDDEKTLFLITGSSEKTVERCLKNVPFAPLLLNVFNWDENSKKANQDRLQQFFEIPHTELVSFSEKNSFVILHASKENCLDLKGIVDNNNDVHHYFLRKCVRYNIAKVVFESESLYDPSNEKFMLEASSDYLPGAQPWESIDDFFSFLIRYPNWLILRNFESIDSGLINNVDEDIDILCDDLKDFVLISNAQKRGEGRCEYYLKVGHGQIKLDLRFIGDKYFDSAWQKEMIRAKKRLGDFYHLDDYNYFYSLLYHIKLQKFSVKEGYESRLRHLWKKIAKSKCPADLLQNDESALLLNDFLRKNSYHYTYTDDARRNELFLQLINRKEVIDLKYNHRELFLCLVSTICYKLKRKLLQR